MLPRLRSLRAGASLRAVDKQTAPPLTRSPQWPGLGRRRSTRQSFHPKFSNHHQTQARRCQHKEIGWPMRSKLLDDAEDRENGGFEGVLLDPIDRGLLAEFRTNERAFDRVRFVNLFQRSPLRRGCPTFLSGRTPDRNRRRTSCSAPWVPSGQKLTQHIDVSLPPGQAKSHCHESAKHDLPRLPNAIFSRPAAPTSPRPAPAPRTPSSCDTESDRLVPPTIAVLQ